MAQYQPNGTPLTDYEREVLTVLMEECAEVTQAASKLLRFGKENRPEPDGRPNTEILANEIGDLRYLLTMVRDLDLYNPQIEVAAQERKHDRMRWYMQTKRTATG
jgi:NTP pyrophosphatase (non-canonical NTP hydrolase)